MSRKIMQSAGPFVFAIGMLLLASGCQNTDPGRKGADAYSSLVGTDGSIRFPDDYPNGYVFIGSWAVSGSEGVDDIHSVYTRPTDLANFKEAGKFLDGAVLVKEVSSTRSAPLTTGNAAWAHEPKTFFLMIKDAKQRFPSNPLWGEGWGWAQFDPNTKKQFATNYKVDCIACHVPVKQNDWVYTYAYPALGPKGQFNIPQGAVKREHVKDTPGSPGHGGVVVAQAVAGDVATGKAAFGKNCAACHSVTAGESGIGPSLAGVAGRKAGTAPGYEYSGAMSKSDIIWTRDNLAKHLEKPRELIPGNRMGNLFPGGVQDAKARAEIVDYLQTVK